MIVRQKLGFQSDLTEYLDKSVPWNTLRVRFTELIEGELDSAGTDLQSRCPFVVVTMAKGSHSTQ